MNLFEGWFKKTEKQEEVEHFDGDVIDSKLVELRTRAQKKEEQKSQKFEEKTSKNEEVLTKIDDTILNEAEKDILSNQNMN